MCILAGTCAKPPAVERVAATLVRVGELLGLTECFYFDGRFHFALAHGWSIAIKPESGSRFRVEACRWSRPWVTLWSLDGEDEHLAGVVLELTEVVSSQVGDDILDSERC